MEYTKKAKINGKLYTFTLTEKKELIFYTADTKLDKMDVFGEDKITFSNLHGKENTFTLFIEIEKFIKYLFYCGVTYFYFSCERPRFEMYEFFIAKVVKGTKYYTTVNKLKNEFYVYKG